MINKFEISNKIDLVGKVDYCLQCSLDSRGLSSYSDGFAHMNRMSWRKEIQRKQRSVGSFLGWFELFKITC